MAVRKRAQDSQSSRPKLVGRETVKVSNTAQAYLSLLGARGIDYFFANGGTDFASIIDGFARLTHERKRVPKPMTVPHEMVAASMAHGYYLATGRPQVVMVHVTVGTANLLNAMINASRAKVPIIFSAGRTPITEKGSPASRNIYIHWAQESFDQGGIAREWTKWDYELRNFDQLETVVDRALSLAMAEPRGPVYLTLPREVLAEECKSFSFSSTARVRPPELAHTTPEGIEEAAAALAKARNPLIITSQAGMWHGAVGQLAILAESMGIPVVETPGRYFMNLPTAHPMHLGFNPHELLADADVILAVESDAPWYPAMAEPKLNATVIQMGTDPLNSNYPIWGFPADIAITVNPEAGLAALNRAIEPYLPMKRKEIETRVQRWTKVHDKQRAAWRNTGLSTRNDKPIDPAWVSRCINEVKDADTICVNEYDLSPLQSEFSEPGTYFQSPPSGGLGWGLGAALGVKLGSGDRTVICTVGDGAYIFGSPSAAHFVARAQNIPVLFVVYNNQCWRAVMDACLYVHPDGYARKHKNFPLSDLGPSPDFDKIVTAFGGYGERVEEPSEMVPALRRALKAVREEKRQAVLNVICKYPDPVPIPRKTREWRP
ncbi:MAG: thiamine pyrophosphate-requiring protein [Candidatus Binataceae bacterium]|nr:thiamine pyrophosphate-requiring protein [Candidatus Binataceae bacterium]